MCCTIVGLKLLIFLFFFKTYKIWISEIYTYFLRMVFFMQMIFLGSITFQLTIRTSPSPHNKSWVLVSTTLISTKFVYEAKFTSWKNIPAEYLFHHFLSDILWRHIIGVYFFPCCLAGEKKAALNCLLFICLFLAFSWRYWLDYNEIPTGLQGNIVQHLSLK